MQIQELYELWKDSKEVLSQLSINPDEQKIEPFLSYYCKSKDLPLKSISSDPERTSSEKFLISVSDQYPLDAAISLAEKHDSGASRVAILSNASFMVDNSRWDGPAMMEEENIYYRTSLAMSMIRITLSTMIQALNPTEDEGIYAPDVVVIYKSPGQFELVGPDEHLPIVSVIRIRAPENVGVEKKEIFVTDGTNRATLKRRVYRDEKDRVSMKMKMRLCLRMAVERKHRLLVLGAFGCGSFGNPSDDVAECWLEVLREREFQQGQWKEIRFAVRGSDFEIFQNVLHIAQV